MAWRYAKLSSGEYLAKGKTATGFANVEEDYADNASWSVNILSRDKQVMPWRIEDEFKKIGANYIQAGLWRGFAVRDGNLITEQQNFSGSETAETMIRALGEYAPVAITSFALAIPGSWRRLRLRVRRQESNGKIARGTQSCGSIQNHRNGVDNH